MIIRYSAEAQDVLLEVAYWIEQQNTIGSGDRYLDKFYKKISSYAKSNVTYALCRDEVLKALGLSCVSIEDWVVAFSILGKDFVVHYIFMDRD